MDSLNDSIGADLRGIEERCKFRNKIAMIQKELEPMHKSKKGYNYKYFDINQMLEQLKPLLEKHKVLVTQPLSEKGVETIIHDLESDSTMGCSIQLPETVKPQDIGSAITYYRRYSLQSFFLMEAEDDDAVKAMPKKKEIDTDKELPF